MPTEPNSDASAESRSARAARLIITGGRPIEGRVTPAGFKHALVPLVAAGCGAQAPLVLENCPSIAESHGFEAILRVLGAEVQLEGNTFTLDARPLTRGVVDCTAAQQIHGSVYLAPALLARFGDASVPTEGGCRIGDAPGGSRPVAHYLSIFERFGARAEQLASGALRVRAPGGSAPALRGCQIDLLDYTADRALRSGPHYSGASKMALLCAAFAHGTSVLQHLYPKPDVTELVRVLRRFGVDIETPSEARLVVHGRGPEALSVPVRHRLIPDLIEIVTWICAGTLYAESSLQIEAPGLERALEALRPELEVLQKMEVPLELQGDSLRVLPSNALRGAEILISSPGVFSDSQPFLALLATYAQGDSSIRETVWSNRFSYVPGLQRLGASIVSRNAGIEIRGGTPPRRAQQSLHAQDLRSAALLLLAALGVPGRTLLSGAHHLDRGYPDLPGSLTRLGAKIEFQN